MQRGPSPNRTLGMSEAVTPSPDPGSVTCWIASLQAGDLLPLQDVWRRYSARIAAEAERRLPRRAASADAEDVAQSVFTAVWRAAESGRLSDIQSRDELWWYLVAIAHRKVTDRVRRATARKRGGGRVALEADLGGAEEPASGFHLDKLMGAAADPSVLVEMQDLYQQLARTLADDLAIRATNARLEGYQCDQIATRLDVSQRTIERKLSLVRGALAKQLQALIDDD